MLVAAIALAVVAFVATLVALCYDPVDRQFRFLYPFRDEETRAFRLPDNPVLVLLCVGFVAMVAMIVISVVDILQTRSATADASRQWERMRSLISDPDIVIIAEFPEATLRQQTAGEPDATRLLDERLALVKETPIPPDQCGGLLIARGTGAVSILGDILAAHGGLDPDDFSMVIGFLHAGKDVARSARSGLDLFDMSMATNAEKADVRLSFMTESRTFRLSLVASGDSLATDPETITATADLPGTTAVLEPLTETNAFERGFVSRIVLRDRRSGASYGVVLDTIAPAAADSGWPPHSLVGVLGPSVPACMPAT
jgi:hypothetical protein